ncbi:hypothetical protein [Umezawaea beigongshangensis]|uniref:hypothetical protein n=1 Tax=Umezawaea beigongshangensis TaxID=2780383 RepID=UPI0018F166E8|nr:hypothetical protein [Umezawaea beigongshangensis]
MRTSKLVAAGLLLLTAVLLLTALLSQSDHPAVGAVAAAVFLPSWYLVAALDARTADRPVRARVVAFGAVFGVPAAVAAGAWFASAAAWDGGPVVHGGRTPLFLAAGLLLWAGVALLTALLGGGAFSATGEAAAIFVPLWTLVCVVNAGIGVVVAGYTVLEEIPVLLLNTAVPAGVALAAWRTSRRGA